MKRRLQEEAEKEKEAPELTVDCWVEVARDDWQQSGALARTCHALLRAMTRPDVLRELVEWMKRAQRRLHWLWLSLPYMLLCEEALRGRIESALPAIRAMAAQRPLEAARGGVCLTGGWVTRQIYGAEWDCDVDCFLSVQSLHGARRTEYFDVAHNLAWDLVRITAQPADRLFEEFDHSLVQHGYCPRAGCEEEGEEAGEFYLTPLACYTYHWHDCILSPTTRNIYYHGLYQTQEEWGDDLCTQSPWRVISAHDTAGHQAPFHACDECRKRHYMEEWCRRVCRYQARFPGFTFSYVRAEGI